MEISKADQEEHDKMLRRWASDLTEQGYTQMCLALPDVGRTTVQIGQHVPDLTAIDPQGRGVIGEVKTANDIDNDHTKEQLTDYLSTRRHVMLLVPSDQKALANDFLNRLGFDGRVQLWTWG